MGTRALKFTVTHPDTEPSSAAVVVRLEGLVARANEQATAQRDGFIQVRAASARKAELRRAMLEVPIAHLADVGEVAAREQHELDKVFRFRPGASTLLAFRAAARGMASAARTHKEVLAKHGLSAPVLEEFDRMLDQFDAAVEAGNDGRTAVTIVLRDSERYAPRLVPRGSPGHGWAPIVRDGLESDYRRNRRARSAHRALAGITRSASRRAGEPAWLCHATDGSLR